MPHASARVSASRSHVSACGTSGELAWAWTAPSWHSACASCPRVFWLAGQVERLTGTLPGLVDASGEERDRAELPEVGGIMAAQRACTEIVPARFL
jgi:hypothetical protein